MLHCAYVALVILMMMLIIIILVVILTHVVRGQRQADVVYFDLSNAFDRAPHNTLLHKLSSFGLSDVYVSWFRSYLTNRQCRVRVSGPLSLHLLTYLLMELSAS
jgi:hypothetical protein